MKQVCCLLLGDAPIVDIRESGIGGVVAVRQLHHAQVLGRCLENERSTKREEAQLLTALTLHPVRA